MKISARNVFNGTISEIKTGTVNTEIEVTLGGNDKIVAIVTNGSVSALSLTVGKAVTAIIKASSILVLTDAEGLALSSRNVLAGYVNKVNNGPVSSEVGISLPSGITLFATITHDAVDALSIQVGSAASAVFKASSVILAATK
ncbi:MAG TPA: TOBE domain-containing protein [Methylophilaceae bacterium]|jgi:molybdate transport system regulatory protein